MKTIKNILGFVIIIFLLGNVKMVMAQEYLGIKAKNGDGIIVLMKKYNLNDDISNTKKFLEINDLKKGAELQKGKSYKLPILEYKYNHKNIRTSLGIENFSEAHKIKKYNDFLINNNLVNKNYDRSGKIYVPFSMIDIIGKGKSERKELTETEKIKEEPKKGGGENKKEEFVREIATKVSKIEKKADEEKLELKRNIDSEKIANDTPVTSGKNSFFGPDGDMRFGVKGTNTGIKRYEPLFGEKWASVPIEEDALNNRVFYILTGHGGPDPGAIYQDGSRLLCEDEYAYDVCLRLARDLMQHGGIVHLIVQDQNDGIRDERYLPYDQDEKTINGSSIPINQKKRLRQRVADINALYHSYSQKKYIKSQTLVEIHVDSRQQKDRIDVFFSYPKKSKESEKLARNIYRVFDKKYSKYQTGRGYEGTTGQQNWYIINNALPSSVFVEMANIKNIEDHERIMNPYNRQAIANWIFQGIYTTYNNK